MQPTDIVQAANWEDQDLQIMARVQGATAANITQADVSSISVHVYDLTDNSEVSGSPATPSVASVVFDTLQTDSRWSEDSTGYNFRHTVVAAFFPTGGRYYRVEANFTMTDGTVLRLSPYRVKVKNRLSS